MMSFSAEAPISSWDKHQLKAELTKINLEGSATILHSANVDGLTLLRATEKYGLASVYNLKIAEAVQIEAYAEKKRKEDERIEAELRKRMEKDKEKQSESHLLVSFTTMS